MTDKFLVFQGECFLSPAILGDLDFTLSWPFSKGGVFFLLFFSHAFLGGEKKVGSGKGEDIF